MNYKNSLNQLFLQLRGLKMNMWNGPIEERSEDVTISEHGKQLSEPFYVKYKAGLVETLNVTNEAIWVTNMKRSIAGILQLDLSNLEKEVAFHSTEVQNFSYLKASTCNIK